MSAIAVSQLQQYRPVSVQRPPAGWWTPTRRPTEEEVTAGRLASLMRALDSEKTLTDDGHKLERVYQWDDPSAPAGLTITPGRGCLGIFVGDVKDVVSNGFAVCEVLRSPKC